MASGDGGAMGPVLSGARDAISGARDAILGAMPSNEDFVDAYADHGLTGRPRREWQNGSAPKQQAVEFPAPSSRLHLPGVGRPNSREEYLETVSPKLPEGGAPPPRMATAAQAVGRAAEMTRQRPPGIPELQPHNFRRDQLKFPTTPEQVADAEAAKRNERLLSLKPQVEFPEEAPPREGDDSMGRLFERSAANGFPVSAAPPGTIGPGPRQIARPTLTGAAAEQEQARGEVMDALAAELGVGPGRTMDPVADQSERILRQKGMIASDPGVPQIDFPLRGRPEEPGSGGRRLAALADTARTVREQAEAQERSRALAEAAAAAKKQREIDEANAAAAKAEQEAERLAAAEERRKRNPMAGIGGVMIDPLERETADVDFLGRPPGPKGSRSAPFAMSPKDISDITGGAAEDFRDLAGPGAKSLGIDYAMLADKMGLPADMPEDERLEKARVFLGDQVRRSTKNSVFQARGGGTYFAPSPESRERMRLSRARLDARLLRRDYPGLSENQEAALAAAEAKGDIDGILKIRQGAFSAKQAAEAKYRSDVAGMRAITANLRNPALRDGMLHESLRNARTREEMAKVFRQFGIQDVADRLDLLSAQENMQEGINEAGVKRARLELKGTRAQARGAVEAAQATADGLRFKTEAARQEAALDRAAAKQQGDARNKTELEVADKTAQAREAANKPEPLKGDQLQNSLKMISDGLINGTYPDAQQALIQYVNNIKELSGGSPNGDKETTRTARVELIRSVLGRTDAMKNPAVLALLEQHVAEAFPRPVGSYLSNPLGQSGAERAAQEFQKEMAALGIEPSNAQTAELYKYLWNRRTSGR